MKERATVRWAGCLPMLVIVAATFIVYAPASTGEFVWDDFYLAENPLLRSAEGLWKIWFHPSAIVAETHYWPLVYTSFWLDQHLWNLNPLGCHLLNVFLHGLNSTLFYYLLRRLEIGGAWPAAMLFALHPVHAESVAWVIERKDLLCGAFYLGGLSAFLRWEREGKRGGYALSLGLFLCAMLSKSVAVSFPVALALIALCRMGGEERSASERRRSGLWVGAWVPFCIAAIVIAIADARYSRRHDVLDFAPLSLADRILVGGRAIWFYTFKLLWPTNLTLVYPRWEITANSIGAWIFPVSLIGASALSGAMFRRMNRWISAMLLFYFAALVPTLGLVEFGYMRYSFVADRFQYLGSLGVFALMGMLADNVFLRLEKPCVESARRAGFGVWAMLFSTLSIVTWNRASVYKNLETLFRDVLVKNPRSWVAHENLGFALDRRGELDEAARHYATAVELNPKHAKGWSNLGMSRLQQGNVKEAAECVERALALEPDFPDAVFNLGAVRVRQARYEDAIECFQRVLVLRPNDAEALYNLGLVYLQMKKDDGAMDCFARAVASKPDHVQALNNLGAALARRGKPAEAAEYFHRAVTLQPDYAEAVSNLQAIRLRMGQKGTER